MTQLLTKSDNFTSEYCCSVVKINEVKPIEGRDKIGYTLVNGETIVVRKDLVKEGDCLLYASNETQLNKDFLSANNLFESSCCELNSNFSVVERFINKNKELKIEIEKVKAKNIEVDDLKNEIEYNTNFIKSHVGFFNKTGRVRAIKLGGVRSMGYLFSIDELAKYNPKVKDINLEELVGEDFDTVDGELFVKAYVPEVKEQRPHSKMVKANKKIERFDRMIKGEFSFHYDTQMFGRNVNLFKPTDKVVITNKLHGCVERNTIINTLEYGDLIIGDIVSKKINCHIKAYDTDINEIVYVPIDNFYTIPNDGEWYEIELENGKKITITGNNPIWLPELGVYRRVDELNGNEKILFSDT